MEEFRENIQDEAAYKSVRDIIRERRQTGVMKNVGQSTDSRLDIDVRKMVIYSEIMNPKYKD